MINFEDLFSQDIKDEIKRLTELLAKLDGTYEDLVDTIKKSRETGTKIVPDGTGKEAKERIENTEKLNKSLNELVLTDKERLKASQALEKQRQRGLTQLAKQEHAQKELIRLSEMEVKSEDDLIKKTNALTKRRRALDTTTEEGRKTHEKWTKTINKNTQTLKKSDAAIDRHQRNVGKYPGLFGKAKVAFMSWATAMKASVILALVAGIAKGFRTLVTSSAEYEKSLSSLQAITGVSTKELGFFSDKAKQFSGETLQSANEIVQAFEKVGSIRPELLKDSAALADVTKQSIILSEATGGKLGLEEAAKATAGTLNQFALASDQAARVTNVLAAGSKFGSAGILEISQAYKGFGTVAADANITLEQSAALVEVAAEKQIIGAEAGTKLRGVTLRLQQAGIGYASGQFNINDALTEANELFSKQASAAERDQLAIKVFGAENITLGKILLNNQDRFAELTEQVTGTNTALEQQQVQNDNLAANWKKLINKITNALTSSKVSGFLNDMVKSILKFFETVGEFSRRTIEKFNDLIRTSAIFRAVIQGIKGAFNVLRETVVQNFKLMIAPFKLIGQIAERIFKREFGEIGNDIKKFGVGVKDSFVAIGETAIEEGKKIKDAFEGTNLESLLIDTTEAEDEFTTSMENNTQAVNDNKKAISDLKQEVEKVRDIFSEIDPDKTSDAVLDMVDSILEETERLDDIDIKKGIGIDEESVKQSIDTLQFAFDSLQETSDILFTGLQNKRQNQLDADLKATEGNEIAQEALRAEFAEKQKKMAITQAIINGSLAVGKTLGSVPFPFNIIAALLVGAKAGIEIANIKKQTFAEGVVDLQGAGTTKSDSIPSMLSKGETVHTAEDTQRTYNFHKALHNKESNQGLMNALIKDTGHNPYNTAMLGLNNKMIYKKENTNDKLYGEQKQTNKELRKLISMQKNKVDRMAVPPEGWIREIYPDGKVKMIKIK